MSADKAKELGLKAFSEICSRSNSRVRTEVMGLGPIYASRKALQRANYHCQMILAWLN